MKKFVCPVCGYVYEGDSAPEKCPQCGCPGSKFEVQEEGKMVWADEHRVGVAKDVDPEILEGLRMNFTGECTEVGMYLAMSRQAIREGYPENGATAGKLDLAKKAKALNLDAIHDTVHEMAKDEARHGCGFEGLLKRYFGK